MDPLDLDRLERVRRWGNVPPPERDEAWIHEFEAAFWPALLSYPQSRPMLNNHDGHIYDCVTVPAGEPPAAVRPAALVDGLIERGHGLFVLNDQDGLLVMLTLSAILSYRLYGRAFSKPKVSPPTAFRINAGQEIGLSPVHEAVFPHPARLNVRRHLQEALGIAAPRAVWTVLPDERSGLTFDLEANRVGDEERVARAFKDLGWFLPARIPFFRIDSLADADEMRPF